MIKHRLRKVKKITFIGMLSTAIQYVTSGYVLIARMADAVTPEVDSFHNALLVLEET